MTTSTPPADGKDALAGLPPMPKTKPAKPAKPRAAKPAAPARTAEDGTPIITRKELFARVKARTGKEVKGAEVRAVMEAVLAEIGDAVVKGETLKLPSLGTLKVQRQKTQGSSDVIVCKLNRKQPNPKKPAAKKPGAGAKDPLAKPAEGS